VDALLLSPEAGVEAAAGEQLGVGALLGEPALVHHEDAVQIDDGRQTVGHPEHRATARNAVDGGVDRDLGAGIKRGRRLVEEQDAGLRSRARAMARRCAGRPKGGSALPTGES